MPRILALDSSTEACSCALTLDSGITESFDIIPRGHTRHMLPMIKKLMNEHELEFAALDAVAVGAGPGSFTGLRIAAGVAQGIAFGAGIPLIPISTLACMAQQKAQSAHSFILSCLDARINEVYWAVFSLQSGKVTLLGEEQLTRPEALLLQNNEPMLAVGNGMEFYQQMPEDTRQGLVEIDAGVYPRASAIAELALEQWQAGQHIDPAEFSPTYLRNQVTQN